MSDDHSLTFKVQLSEKRATVWVTDATIMAGDYYMHEFTDEPVTVAMSLEDARTNTLRGVSLPSQNAKRTHCPKGHSEWAREIAGDRSRYCIPCRQAKQRRWNETVRLITGSVSKKPDETIYTTRSLCSGCGNRRLISPAGKCRPCNEKVSMVVTCGVTHTNERSEAIVRFMREQQGYAIDGGCGRPLDLTNALQQAITYRCVECGRWMCRPCILKHFAETGDDHRIATPEGE